MIPARKRAKQFFRSFRDHLKSRRLFRWTLLVSFLLCVATLVFPIWRLVPLSKDQPFIPLHYNVYFGVDRFGAWYEAFLIPVLGFLFLFLNLLLQMHFYKSEKLLAIFFAISTIFLELTFFVAMVLLILLNL